MEFFKLTTHKTFQGESFSLAETSRRIRQNLQNFSDESSEKLIGDLFITKLATYETSAAQVN